MGGTRMAPKNPAAVALGKLSAAARRGKTDYSALGRRAVAALKRKYGPGYWRRIRRGDRPAWDHRFTL